MSTNDISPHRWKYAVPCQGWLKGSAIIRTLKIGPQVSLSTGQTRNEHLMIAASFFPRARSSVATGNSRIAATELVSPDISNRARYFMVSFGDNHKHLHERQRRFLPQNGPLLLNSAFWTELTCQKNSSRILLLSSSDGKAVGISVRLRSDYLAYPLLIYITLLPHGRPKKGSYKARERRLTMAGKNTAAFGIYPDEASLRNGVELWSRMVSV